MVEKLNIEESIENQWRSFTWHFSKYWDSARWPEADFPVFPYFDMTNEDRAQAKTAKAWITFKPLMFVGGRGEDSDNDCGIYVFVKRTENVYDRLLLQLMDSILEVYENTDIALYDFRGENIQNPEASVSDYPLYPIFVSAEEDPEYSDNDTRCFEMLFSLAGLRPRRRIDLRS